MEKEKITEEMKIHKAWYKEAKDQTLETLPFFMEKLATRYSHDYGTICHALSATAIGAAHAMNHSESGGISGFQAGAIMWGFIQHWNHESNTLGLKLIDYDDLLYPQYEEKFDNIITEEHWERVKKAAKAKLSTNGVASPNVRAHWQSIVNNNLPFGFVLKKPQ